MIIFIVVKVLKHIYSAAWTGKFAIYLSYQIAAAVFVDTNKTCTHVYFLGLSVTGI